MAVAVLMPRQGQSVESCIITRWHKSKGDKIEKGDILFSYETDKAAFEEEAKDDGVLLDVFFDEGDEVPVLETVAVIGSQGEKYDNLVPAAARPVAGRESIQEAGPAPGKPDPAAGADAAAPEAAGPAPGKPDPAAEPEAAEPVPGGAGAGPISGVPDAGTKIRISPLARKIAGSLGIPVRDIKGTGPKGRIIERDVRSAAAEAKPMDTGKPGDDSKFTKLSNMRRLIARRMQESLQNSAQLTHHISADARKLLALRKEFKSSASPETAGININDMVCFAVVRALKEYPFMNAHFEGEGIRTFNKVHLGIAVDTERGLMVPAIRNADDMNIGGLAGRIRLLAEECRKGNIDPDLLNPENAGFTVSNLGAYGIEMFTPVLNLPQVGILGVNTITYRPADTGDGTIAFLPVIGLSLTYDHRAVDGAPASAFLSGLKKEIENIKYC